MRGVRRAWQPKAGSLSDRCGRHRDGVLADDGSLVHVGTWEGTFVYDTATGRREPASPAPAVLDELDVASGDGSVLVHEDGPTITTYMPVLP